jgi:hypothetical protein
MNIIRTRYLPGGKIVQTQGGVVIYRGIRRLDRPSEGWGGSTPKRIDPG